MDDLLPIIEKFSEECRVRRTEKTELSVLLEKIVANFIDVGRFTIRSASLEFEWRGKKATAFVTSSEACYLMSFRGHLGLITAVIVSMSTISLKKPPDLLYIHKYGGRRDLTAEWYFMNEQLLQKFLEKRRPVYGKVMKIPYEKIMEKCRKFLAEELDHVLGRST